MLGKLDKLAKLKQYEKVRNGQAELNLFVRRALVAFIGVLMLTGTSSPWLFRMLMRRSTH